MNELVKIKNTSYAEYEALLIRRDVLRKEAFTYRLEYIREFGDLINRVFKAMITCIEKKKIIAWCQSRVNRGLPLNSSDLDAFIGPVMEEYYARLSGMLEESEALKKRGHVTEMTYRRIKSLYRKLARMVHPDMHKELADDETVRDLWNRITAAYSCNDLPELENLHAALAAYLQSIHYDCEQPEIPDLPKRISQLETEIRRILDTDPYRYKYLLRDTEAVEDKKQELEAEIAEYETYAEQLDEVIDSFGIRRVLS